MIALTFSGTLDDLCDRFQGPIAHAMSSDRHINLEGEQGQKPDRGCRLF